MLKFENETNWANNVLGLRRDYNLPLNDDNIKKMPVSQWKCFVKSAILNPITYGILRLSQLRGGGGIFISHPRKQC